MRLSSHNLGCYKLTKAEQYKIVFLKGKKGHVRYLMLSNLLLLYLFTWRLLLMLIISNYKLLSFFKLDQMYFVQEMARYNTNKMLIFFIAPADLQSRSSQIAADL